MLPNTARTIVLPINQYGITPAMEEVFNNTLRSKRLSRLRTAMYTDLQVMANNRAGYAASLIKLMDQLNLSYPKPGLL